MGRFSVDVELANHVDVATAKGGYIPTAQIRKAIVRGVVDTGATRLVLPASTITELGLVPEGQVSVRYADGRTATRSLVHDVQLTYAGRSGVFTAVVEPDRDSALIGAIVLEDLDLIVECGRQLLVPRDPKQIISEIE